MSGPGRGCTGPGAAQPEIVADSAPAPPSATAENPRAEAKTPRGEGSSLRGPAEGSEGGVTGPAARTGWRRCRASQGKWGARNGSSGAGPLSDDGL